MSRSDSGEGVERGQGESSWLNACDDRSPTSPADPVGHTGKSASSPELRAEVGDVRRRGPYSEAFHELGQMGLLVGVMVSCVGGTFLPFWLGAWWLSGEPIPAGSDVEGPWPVLLFAVGMVLALSLGIALTVATVETIDNRRQRHAE